MANFKDWALQYVLADDESTHSKIALQATKEIEAQGANRTVVGNWAASVQPWLQPPEDEQMGDGQDGQDGASGNIIARAKALGFLADTLGALDKDILKPDQISLLVNFFGTMFSYDHKAGIDASASALRYLNDMKSFKPAMGVKMIEDVCKLKEDFRLQTPATRLKIFTLILKLLKDQPVSSELQHKYGSSGGFIVDLLQMCRYEKNQENIILWFQILRTLLADFEPSDEVTDEIFAAFSAYFPISLGGFNAAQGITTDLLKGELRSCFSAHQRVGRLVFPFLLSKLDQGDAVTVAVKVDILRTMKASIESYDHPQTSVVPHIDKIWNSLKYEVRNGEVEETSNETLQVLQAIANKLDGTESQKNDVSLLKDYIDLVFKDCGDDLSNPTYTKSAGRLMMAVLGSNFRAFSLQSSSYVDSIRHNLQQPKSPNHTRDLLHQLNLVLTARIELLNNKSQWNPQDQEALLAEPTTYLEALFHNVYLPTWNKSINDSSSEATDVLKEVIRGLALLVGQQIVRPDGTTLLSSEAVCSEISSLLTQRLIRGFALSPNDRSCSDTALEDEAVSALQTIASSYRHGYADFAALVKSEIRGRAWENASAHSLDDLKVILGRLAYIGCARIPSKPTTSSQKQKPYSPLQHLITFLTTAFDLISPPLSDPKANSIVVAQLRAGLLYFRDACTDKPATALATISGDKTESKTGDHPENWLRSLQNPGDMASDEILWSLESEGPEVYRQFLRLGLVTVRQLYQAVVGSTPQALANGLVVQQIAGIATFVIGSLNEKLQIQCSLARQGLEFFRDQRTGGVESGLSGPIRNGLILGILGGLRPAAMTELYQPGGFAEKFLCDVAGLAELRRSSPAALKQLFTIAAVLANKFKGTSTSPEAQTIKEVYGFWGQVIKDAVASMEHDTATFEALSRMAMHIILGSITRQDKNVLELTSVLRETIANEHSNGDVVASSLGTVLDNSCLLNVQHGVTRPLWKQWTYAHLVQPLYEVGLSTTNTPLVSTRYSTAILSMISNCPFKAYESDLVSLTRLLMTAFAKGVAAGLPTDSDRQRLVNALKIVREILSNEPTVLKEHLKPVIQGAIKISRLVSQSSIADQSPETKERLLVLQREALQVLGSIPEKFEERHVRSYAPEMQLLMAQACGSPTRELRKIAREARSNWAKFSE